jgi:hypothetical protein
VSTDPLARLVDDAAIFPPGDAALEQAVPAHREHRAASYAALVGPFVVSDQRLPDLLALVAEEAGSPAPLPVSVVVSGGAGALAPAVRWAGRGGLDLRSVEIALRDADGPDLAHNTRRILAAVDDLLSAGDLADDVPVYVEAPRLRGPEPSPSWLSALDELATRDHRLKLRTGGLDADAFPDAAELAACIGAALDRELAFKCTAGLHHALRHRAPDTGFEHHGFLNVLLGTRASLDGAAPAEVVAVLEDRDAASVLDRWHEAGTDALVSARRWFTSFGSCSVTEPVEDLAALGLLGQG